MRQTTWRWAKRGILAVIALAVLSVSALGLFIIYERHRQAEFSRTHEHPLADESRNLVVTSALMMLAQLQPASGPNSLRLVAMPSFGERWFAVSVTLTHGQGMGEAVVTSPTGQIIKHQHFAMPEADLLQFLDAWDAMVDGYGGEGRVLTDGTALAFERRRGARITSGQGNSPCHYDVLGDWAAQALERYIPEMRDLRNPQLAMLLTTKFCNPPLFDVR